MEVGYPVVAIEQRIEDISVYPVHHISMPAIHFRSNDEEGGVDQFARISRPSMRPCRQCGPSCIARLDGMGVNVWLSKPTSGPRGASPLRGRSRLSLSTRDLFAPSTSLSLGACLRLTRYIEQVNALAHRLAILHQDGVTMPTIMIYLLSPASAITQWWLTSRKSGPFLTIPSNRHWIHGRPARYREGRLWPGWSKAGRLRGLPACRPAGGTTAGRERLA